MNYLLFFASLQETLKGLEESGRIQFVVPATSLLTPSGRMAIPLVLREDETYYAIFPYAAEDTAAASKFAGAKAVLAEFEVPYVSLYYCPTPLGDAEPVPSFSAFDPGWFVIQEEHHEGEFAMWHASERDADFGKSLSRQAIARAYELSDGATGYIAAALLRSFGLIPEDTMRVALSEELGAYPVTGPSEEPMYVSFCAEKGVRFHFNKETSAEYRDLIWKFFADYCDNMRMQLLEMGAPLDDPSAPFEWWQFLDKSLLSSPGETIEVGKLMGPPG